MYKPENLKIWESPKNYMGEQFPDYYPTVGQTRDSGPLSRSNFDAMLNELGGESKVAVIVVRASHWAVGWVESIMIHKSATKKLKIADQIMGAMNDYPVIDDELFSRYEMEEKEQLWNSLNLKERIEICAEHNVSIFAARQEFIPESLEQYLEIYGNPY